MFDAYNAESRNIGDLLSDNLRGRIVVPKFQRGYSWGKKHVEAFWDDVRRFQKESQVKGGPDKYFLGPIVVMQDESDKEIIYILDGQQRLATATILFSVLRDVARQLPIQEATSFVHELQNHLISKEDFGYCLELGVLDREYFIATVQANPATIQKAKIRSHRNIAKAHEVLLEKVKSILPSDPTAALKELNALRRTIRGDLIMASIPVKSQRDAFRIFETLNDRGLRLSVPDLLLNYLMGYAVDDAERNSIRKYWDGMIEGMGRRDIGQFLRHAWVSKYGDLKSQDLFTALKTDIEAKKISSLDFAKSCAEDCVLYIELLNANPEELETAAPYIKVLVRDLNFDITLPLLLSAHTKFSNSDLEKVAKWLLVFVTRYTIILGLDPSGLETVLYALARDTRTQPVISNIKDTLRRKAPNDDQIEAVKNEDLILEPYDAVYMLTCLANLMQGKTKELQLKEANVEHIFPQNPSGEWKNAGELEPFLWHLGNLTMLGERLNTKVANLGFDKKKGTYAKSELEMAKQVAAYKVWDVAAVLDRAKKMLPLIVQVWNFDNPSRV
jgi:hypothetical protein